MVATPPGRGPGGRLDPECRRRGADLHLAPMGVCENCAADDDELILVRRVYVTPERWDQPESVQIVEPPELWCVSCISQYPNEPVD